VLALKDSRRTGAVKVLFEPALIAADWSMGSGPRDGSC
jgi:hypothetical protein